MFDEAGFNLQLAINVPVSALLKLPIPALVEEHRPKSDRWPGIILEVTEDQIVRDLKLAQRDRRDQLRVSGIKIAIDDFGAGYSSLSSLRDLPFVEIKLDHSFVQQLRDRRHQCGDLPDRDRSRAPLRQRGGRRRASRARPTCRRSW